MARGEKTELSENDISLICSYAGLLPERKIALMVGLRAESFRKLLDNPNHEASIRYAEARNERLRPIASDVYQKAIEGDQKAQFFVLARMGGWTEKQEIEMTKFEEEEVVDSTVPIEELLFGKKK